MVSNQVLQNTIEGIKEISHLELGIMDADGREVAVTAPVFADAAGAIPDFAVSPADSQSAGPYQFFKVMDEQQLEYVIVVYGETDSSLLIGRMAAFQLKGLMSAFKERYDKDSFMKNLLLDNLLLVDIYSRAKKLHIVSDAQRVVLIVETGQERDRNVLEVVQEFIGTTTMDFVTAVDEYNVVGRVQRSCGQGPDRRKQDPRHREDSQCDRRPSSQGGDQRRPHCVRHSRW